MEHFELLHIFMHIRRVFVCGNLLSVACSFNFCIYDLNIENRQQWLK